MRPRRGWHVLLALIVLLVPAGCAGAAARPGPPGHGPAHFDPSFRHGTVGVDGETVHYVRGGSGPPLVLLHGWPKTWWAWHRVMPRLAREHTVIAIDLPGLGDSSAPRDGYDKATTAHRVREAVRRLGLHQVRILGHDLGATVGYLYARDFPAEVSRLAVLEAPLPGFGLQDYYGFSWHFLFNATAAPVPERLIDDDDVRTYLGYIYDGTRHPDAIGREAYFRAYADPADRAAGYDYYRTIDQDTADIRAGAQAKPLRIPVLAMGAQDVFGPAIAESFRHVAADVREVVAPDSGHFIPEENPGFLIDCARLFFGATAREPGPRLAGCAR